MAYAKYMFEQLGDTFVWSADPPEHFVFISGSAEASEEFVSDRFATKR